ncbi:MULTISPECIES: hypothetical protein [unclassified Chitinophaga]|uniref:hypothetical protein n=1 Tax=unclassified Chitinophaga TaxID=2619133 RepID=UPI00300FC72C
MSKQDGLLQFDGAIENLSFYKTKRGYAVRKRSGVSGARISNDPAFKRTRENGQEFGRAGKASKLLRTSFRDMIKNTADKGATPRLTKEFVKVVKADATSDRGLRNVIDGEIGFIENFEFNMNSLMDTSLFAPLTANIDRVAGTGTIELPAFKPVEGIQSPDGATHFIITCGVSAIDFTGGKYESALVSSEVLVLDSNNTAPLKLTASVSPNSTFPMFLALSIEFIQVVNGKPYKLSNGTYNSMKVVAVSASV